MTIVEKVITARVQDLLKELEVLSMGVIDTVKRRQNSTVVSDFTKAGEMSTEHSRRVGVIHFQLSVLKGFG